MYARIIGGTLIQLSEQFIEGYSDVVVEDKPIYDKDTHHLTKHYTIEDGGVHQFWQVEEGGEQITDAEALQIING